MSDDLTRRTAAYEAAMAGRLGRRIAVAFAFARHALAFAIRAAGVRSGQDVVLSPLTCRVVPLALLWVGARPIYADVDPQTLNLGVAGLREALGRGAAAVVFQHTYGGGAGLEAAAAAARHAGSPLIEDCAQCVPVRTDAFAPGTAGQAAVFSNNALKPLPAGSGGVLVTDDQALGDRVRRARDELPVRGRLEGAIWNARQAVIRTLVGPRTYWPVLSTYRLLSSRFRDGPLAEKLREEIDRLAVRPGASQISNGLAWERRAEAIAAHRQACCDDYRRLLGARGCDGLVLPGAHGPLLYFPILTDRKHAILDAARTRRLQVVAWPGETPIYPHEDLCDLRAYGYTPGSCPEAERTASQLLGLPTDPGVGPSMRRALADVIAKAVRR
jgi:dTDP-4-amino-4,6-dideoxygalactose transaminase